MTDQKMTIQIQADVVIEIKVEAKSLADALVIADSMGWEQILPDVGIVDGEYRTVGVFEPWCV